MNEPPLPRLRKPSPTSTSNGTPIRHSKPHSPLLSYHEISSWHQDNEFILSGYRAETNSTPECFASWGYLHNETVNIYSHLLPAIFSLFALVLSYHLCLHTYPEATRGDRLALEYFLLTAAICLGTSALYHTLLNHSEEVASRWLRLDFLGIIVLIEGFFVSGVYVTFYCEPGLQKIYWTMILTLGIISATIIVHPKFQGRAWRTFRLSTFILTGLSAVAPITHGIKIFGWKQMNRQSGLPYYLLEGVLLLIGAFFYNVSGHGHYEGGWGY
ncbi:hemolysin-III family protein [Wilcoxina mikolae CBS 423.85]|nr:hemolysin-III family protein [Wilcoxina mikolae CBS 423.85]